METNDNFVNEIALLSRTQINRQLHDVSRLDDSNSVTVVMLGDQQPCTTAFKAIGQHLKCLKQEISPVKSKKKYSLASERRSQHIFSEKISISRCIFEISCKTESLQSSWLVELCQAISRIVAQPARPLGSC